MTLGCTFCAKIDYPVAPVWMQCGHEPPVPNPRDTVRDANNRA